MSKHIAFLRAINVGGHTVKMDHLRQLFEAMGLTQVETFIASGNVIFDSPNTDTAALEDSIAAELRKALGYDVATFIRSPHALSAIAQYRPFDAADLSSAAALNITFVAQWPNAAAQARLLALGTPNDAFHIHDREVYWLCRSKISESVINGKSIEKALGLSGTMRNITTVQKLAAKYSPS